MVNRNPGCAIHGRILENVRSTKRGNVAILTMRLTKTQADHPVLADGEGAIPKARKVEERGNRVLHLAIRNP